MALSLARRSRDSSLTWAADRACAEMASLHVLACAAVAATKATAAPAAASVNVERIGHPPDSLSSDAAALQLRYRRNKIAPLLPLPVLRWGERQPLTAASASRCRVRHWQTRRAAWGS